jgi:hypothetical protein
VSLSLGPESLLVSPFLQDAPSEVSLFRKSQCLPNESTKAPVKAADVDEDAEDFEDDDGFDDEELVPKKLRKSKAKVAGKSGSKFIPAFKK